MNVLITGGSRGIGAAAVRAFSARGDRVAFFYEKEDEKAAAVAAGMNKPSSSQINYIDLSAPDSVELCEAQNVSVLSRVFTSLGQGVFSVVEYFS